MCLGLLECTQYVFLNVVIDSPQALAIQQEVIKTTAVQISRGIFLKKATNGFHRHTSSTEVSKTRNRDGSLDSSDQPTISRQLTALASFSPAPANIPSSSSVNPRKMRKRRVKIQGSAVTEISTAAAILLGERNR
jgi:hypothetical protein